MRLVKWSFLLVAVYVAQGLVPMTGPGAAAQAKTKEAQGEAATEGHQVRDPVTGQIRGLRGSEKQENVTAPVPIDKPAPPYTKAAQKAKLEGTVVLRIVIGSDGNVTDVGIIKPLGKGLDESAVKTVQTWKFKPATRNGKPVAVRVMVEVSFKLKKK